MARFLDSMKAAESGHAIPPAVPPLTLVAAETTADEVIEQAGPDDEPPMPYIEVGPSRLVEGSPDVLAYKPIAYNAVERPTAVAPVVCFRPLNAPVEVAPGIAAEVIAFHQPRHPASAQYAEVLSAVLAAFPGRTSSALFFTGSAAGVGTTTVVLNLAVTSARQGRRVLVVDGNPRRPAVAARLALCDRPGLNEVLAGVATLEEGVQDTEQNGLSALTAGASSVPALRSAESFRSLLRQLRLRFDLVLIDGPHWDGRPDVTAPGTASDATFLVVPAGADDTSATSELIRQLPASGLRLAGCVAAGR